MKKILLKYPSLVTQLSTQVHPKLAQQLVDEFSQLTESYQLHKWKYSELDGGRFCEVVARIIYVLDSQVVNLNKPVGECLAYIENNNARHHFPIPKTSIPIARVVKSVYKLRSQRGAVHVSPDFTADEVDARLIFENCSWLFIEIVRLFSNLDKAEVVELIQSILRFRLTLVRDFGNLLLVQNTNLTTEEEILILLYHSGTSGVVTKELLKNIPKDNSGIRKSLKKLSLSKYRQAIFTNEAWVITDLGVSRITPIILALE